MSKTKAYEHFNLGICGPTGAGKSTIARAIATLPRVSLIPEIIPEKLLERFVNEPRKYAYDLQREIVTSRLDMWMKARFSPIIVWDRTAEEDREVFFNLHFRLGFLSATQLEKLRQLSFEVEASAGKPDAMIYVSASVESLKKRLINDGKPNWLLDTLDLQLSMYREYQAHLPCVQLEIDTTVTEPSQLVNLSTWIYDTMMEASRGRLSYNSQFEIGWAKSNSAAG